MPYRGLGWARQVWRIRTPGGPELPGPDAVIGEDATTCHGDAAEARGMRKFLRQLCITNRLCGALRAAFTLPFSSLHFCYLYSVGCPAVNVCGCLPAFVTLSGLGGLADWMWRCRGAACPRGDHHNGLTQHLTRSVAAGPSPRVQQTNHGPDKLAQRRDTSKSAHLAPLFS